MKAAFPANEVARLETLHGCALLDTLPQQAYDDITLLAAHICQTPIAAVSLVDQQRQWFKSKVGLDVDETSRDISFCAHAILEPEQLLVVPDAQLDARFSDNPLVSSAPHIRFYAGAPLVTEQGHALGSLCVIDQTPRQLSAFQIQALQALSRQVMAQFTLHQQTREMAQLNGQLERLSVRDELTGLQNRRAFDIALRRELARAIRYGAPLSLVLFDIDHFRSYNESFGPQAGDEVLRMVGAMLPRHLEEMAVAARYGGEEFALVLPDTNREIASRIAERVRLNLEQTHWPRRAVTASFGAATLTDDLQTETTLIEAADAALYASKNAGRNRITHHRALG